MTAGLFQCSPAASDELVGKPVPPACPPPRSAQAPPPGAPASPGASAALAPPPATDSSAAGGSFAPAEGPPPAPDSAATGPHSVTAGAGTSPADSALIGCLTVAATAVASTVRPAASWGVSLRSGPGGFATETSLSTAALYSVAVVAAIVVALCIAAGSSVAPIAAALTGSGGASHPPAPSAPERGAALAPAGTPLTANERAQPPFVSASLVAVVAAAFALASEWVCPSPPSLLAAYSTPLEEFGASREPFVASAGLAECFSAFVEPAPVAAVVGARSGVAAIAFASAAAFAAGAVPGRQDLN